eukprot:m.43389 g.43389  ORF g.43389 m.43389 type:complete len:195 (+) comp12920_c0_seq1:120-704(+)
MEASARDSQLNQQLATLSTRQSKLELQLEQQQTATQRALTDFNTSQLHCRRLSAKCSSSCQQLQTVCSQLVQNSSQYSVLLQDSLFQQSHLWQQLDLAESDYNSAVSDFIRQEFQELQAQLPSLVSPHHGLIDLESSTYDEMVRLRQADAVSHVCLAQAQQDLACTQAELQCLDSLERNLDTLPWRAGQEEVCT